MYKFLNKEYEVLTTPFTKKQITALEYSVSAVIEVELSDILKRDIEGFLDFLEEQLVAEGFVIDLHFEIVGCSDKNTVLLLVSADIDNDPFDED